MNKNIPFVGLHAHSVSSVFDGLGYPSEHMDFAFSNGSDALALTDHGNMNGLSYQVLHAKKMEKTGKNFKPIYGCEIYYIDSVEEWQKEYDRAQENKREVNKIKAGLTTSATIVETEDRETNKKKNPLNKRAHMVLIVQNQKGLNNLFQLISKSYTSEYFYRFPRIDYKLLKEHSEGLIATSACLGGVYAQDFWENKDDPQKVLSAMSETTEKMQSIFGDRWYGEVQWNAYPEQHMLNKYVIQVCKKHNVEVVSTADSHYPRPELWKDRELYKKLGWLSKNVTEADLPEDKEEMPYELYPKNGQQMWESYKKYSAKCEEEYDDDFVLDTITRTHKIAHERVEKFYPDNTVRLPDFVVPDGKSATRALAEFCLEGLRNFRLQSNKEYVQRIKEELAVIDERGFSKYFLTMKAISDKAQEIQLVGPGRGSAAGSLVAYVLGITQIDPIKYGLLFSRFLRSDATDYPDIDYDVSDPMELKEKLIGEWGDSTVVPISNWNTLQLKSLIKDISKLYGIPFAKVNEVTGKMINEATPQAKKKNGITAGVYNPTFDEVMEFSETLKGFLQEYPHVKTHVQTLYGQIRSASRHAGGCLVGEKLDYHMPLINSGGVRQTPWSEGQNVRHLEPMGFIKFDILGLSTLRMIESCIEKILRRHYGYKEVNFSDIKKFYDENLHPDKIELKDNDVYRNIFSKGKWAGVFQFTEAGAQNFCVQAKPDSIIDIAAITSIFRPGPLAAKVDKMYVDAKNNPQNIGYLHPLVEEVTKETYGFLIFQEQIAIIANKLGKDINMDEANTLRKVLTKKGTGKEAEVKNKLHKKFMDGCIEKGIDKTSAQELWDKFEFFSGYGFNKSHAVSYSILSYQCAWLLNYYAPEWLAAFLDKEPETRKEKAINIVKSFGYGIEKIDINKSRDGWEISDDNKRLIQPFSSIKGLGDAAIKQILDNRPFGSIDDVLFSETIVHSKLNKKALDVLCRSGAFDEFIDDRFSGPKHFWSSFAANRPKNPKRFKKNIEEYTGDAGFTIAERIDNSLELTGVFPTELVMNTEVKERIKVIGARPLNNYVSEEDTEYDLPPALDNQSDYWWFIPRSVVLKKTAKGKHYYVLKVIDSTNNLNTLRVWGASKFYYDNGERVEKLREIFENKPYCVTNLKYDPTWGFSIHGAFKCLKLLDG